MVDGGEAEAAGTLSGAAGEAQGEEQEVRPHSPSAAAVCDQRGANASKHHGTKPQAFLSTHPHLTPPPS